MVARQAGYNSSKFSKLQLKALREIFSEQNS